MLSQRDPFNSWGLEALAVEGTRHYQTTTAQNVTTTIVAVLDSGQPPPHEEFLFVTIAEPPSGWECGGQNPQDGTGHGTASVGLMVGNYRNGRGSFGVAGGTSTQVSPLTIVPCKVTAQEAHVRDALRKVINPPINAKVVMINWDILDPAEPAGTPDNTLGHALTEAVDLGVAVIVPSGNNFLTSLSGMIAGDPRVIGVGALNDEGQRAEYSNYEANHAAETVKFLAPGTEVISTWHEPGNATYNWFGGTSAAAPLTAAVYGLLRSMRPDLSVAELTQILCETATIIGENQQESGCGVPNLARAIAHPLFASASTPLPALPHFTRVPTALSSIPQELPYQFDFDVLGESSARYEIVRAPQGAFISDAGIFSWTPPSSSRHKSYSFLIRASNKSGSVEHFFDLAVLGPVGLPFRDDLEEKTGKEFSPAWHMEKHGSGARIRIDDESNGGIAGSPSYMRLLRWAHSSYSSGLTGATLKVDTQTLGNDLVLQFSARRGSTNVIRTELLPNGPGCLYQGCAQENDPLKTPNQGAWGEGVAVSINGVTWYRASDLRCPQGEPCYNGWEQRTVNLTQLLSSYGQIPGPLVYVKFLNFAEANAQGSNSDELRFDNFCLYELGSEEACNF